MGFHTFDPDRAAKLEDPARLRYCSRDELVGALSPATDDYVADLGSGTGFYTREVAPFAGRVAGVDVQDAMHEQFREHGVPSNVTLVTADVAALPFADDELDGAFSTMTFHEFATPDALAEVRRTLAAGARFVVADWSAAGDGEDGPPLGERYDGDDATERLAAAGFEVSRVVERPETLFVVARA
jgi:ubiquinone/menaquinone biosynthesis C-methylase UbiE